MPRYKLTIEYDGTPFVGWQMQDNGVSVQGVLTDAIAALAGEQVTVSGAGRTDTGVHALGQVAHIDLAKDWDTGNVRDGINFHLRPQPVAVLAAEQAAADFDARFAAVKRHYLYRIVNRRADLTLDLNRAWRVPRPLDSEAMHEIAGEDARPSRCFAPWRRSPHRRIGAFVPAASGTLDGRFARPCRRGQMERR
jgi:tRNA pseudouridine38-40 synthase